VSKRKTAPHRGPGRQVKHGAYSIVYREEMVKRHPELARYVQDCHNALLADLAPEGPETLSAAKTILLDRCTAALLMAGQLEIYLGTHGLLRRDRLDQKVIEAEPALESWLHVNRAILRDLEALGLERVELGPRNLTPDEMLADAHEDVLAQEAAGKPDKGDGDA